MFSTKQGGNHIMSHSINVEKYIDPSYKLYINGEWTDGSEGKRIESSNPSTGEKLAEFIDASHADVDTAVEAAQKAFPDRKSTRLNSSHVAISYAVFCL